MQGDRRRYDTLLQGRRRGQLGRKERGGKSKKLLLPKYSNYISKEHVVRSIIRGLTHLALSQVQLHLPALVSCECACCASQWHRVIHAQRLRDHETSTDVDTGRGRGTRAGTTAATGTTMMMTGGGSVGAGQERTAGWRSHRAGGGKGAGAATVMVTGRGG